MSDVFCVKCGNKNERIEGTDFSFCVVCGSKIVYPKSRVEEKAFHESEQFSEGNATFKASDILHDSVKQQSTTAKAGLKGLLTNAHYYIDHFSELSGTWEKIIFLCAIIGCPATILTAALSFNALFEAIFSLGILVCIAVMVLSKIFKNKHPEFLTMDLCFKLALIGLIVGIVTNVVVTLLYLIYTVIASLNGLFNSVSSTAESASNLLGRIIDLFSN